MLYRDCLYSSVDQPYSLDTWLDRLACFRRGQSEGEAKTTTSRSLSLRGFSATRKYGSPIEMDEITTEDYRPECIKRVCGESLRRPTLRD
jgi:hypothetical protein